MVGIAVDENGVTLTIQTYYSSRAGLLLNDSDDPQGPYAPLSVHHAQAAVSHYDPHISTMPPTELLFGAKYGCSARDALLAWLAELNGEAANAGPFAASVAGRAVLVTLLVHADNLAIFRSTKVVL